MALSRQAGNLQRQGAAMRSQIFARTSDDKPQRALYNESIAIDELYFSPASVRALELGLNLREGIDTVVRFAKKALAGAPQVGKKIRIYGARPDGADLVVRFAQFATLHPTSAEWILGCKEI